MHSRPAFLVTHGSFNPVHRHHLEMMVRAREVLEENGFTVVRGLMAITPTKRLVNKGAEAVTDSHRLAALQHGCDSVPGPSGWLQPEPRGVNYGSGGQLVKGLLPELLREQPGSIVFKVVGADTAVRYKSELKGPIVIVGREGSTADLNRAIAKAGTLENAFVVEELSGAECSSTKLRSALHRGDGDAVRQMCPPLVAKYLCDHAETLYTDEGVSALSVNSVDRAGGSGSNDVFVLGICGASRSGKSTLARQLQAMLGGECQIVGQDDYRLKGKWVAEESWMEKDGVWVRNWETPKQTCWAKLEEDISAAMQVSRVVVVEGYSLLYSDRVTNLLNGLIWIEVNETECRTRRKSIPKGWEKKAYFDECIWPAHCEYVNLVYGDSRELGQAGKSAAFRKRVLELSGQAAPKKICTEAATTLQKWRACDVAAPESSVSSVQVVA